HSSHHRLANRDLHDLAGALDLVALADGLVVAEQRDADVVFFEIEHHAHDWLALGAAELEQLAGHGAGQAVHARNAVAGGQHGAGLHDRHLLVILLNLLANDLADLFGADFHLGYPLVDSRQSTVHSNDASCRLFTVDC